MNEDITADWLMEFIPNSVQTSQKTLIAGSIKDLLITASLFSNGAWYLSVWERRNKYGDEPCDSATIRIRSREQAAKLFETMRVTS